MTRSSVDGGPLRRLQLLAIAGRRVAQVVRMIPPPADRSGMTSTPLRSPLRARRMIGIYDNEENIRHASRPRARHRQVVG